jgi:undecaprenyl-diphosphatase
VKERVLAAGLLAVSLHAFAQSREPSSSVFTWTLEQDLPLGVLSLAVALTPLLTPTDPGPLPGKLERRAVPFFDRPLMAPYHEGLDLASSYGVYGLLLLPALSVAPNAAVKGTLPAYAVMYAEAFLLTAGTKNLLKNAVSRYRPYVYADGVPPGKEDDYDNSFPSGSTAYAFLGAGFLSATYRAEFPESRWNVPIIAGGYTLATGIAAMRIASGSHFLSDVLAGAAIGSFYGWLLPALHRKSARSPFTLRATPAALTVSLRF